MYTLREEVFVEFEIFAIKIPCSKTTYKLYSLMSYDVVQEKSLKRVSMFLKREENLLQNGILNFIIDKTNRQESR